jgi:hypothetical protein
MTNDDDTSTEAKDFNPDGCLFTEDQLINHLRKRREEQEVPSTAKSRTADFRT